jgi:CBS domain-containing protein
MDDIYVARLMSTSLVTVTPETLVEEAATLMLSEDISSLIVTDDDGELAGILTTTDFVDIVSKSHPKAETAVSRYMTTDLYTTTAQTPIQEVAEEMVERGIHHTPVVDPEEGVIGIVTTSDLAAYVSSL